MHRCTMPISLPNVVDKDQTSDIFFLQWNYNLISNKSRENIIFLITLVAMATIQNLMYICHEIF